MEELAELLDEEAAAFLQEGGTAPGRNRRWERANPPTAYRLDEEINDRVKVIKDELEADGFQTTTSAIAEALLWRGLAAWDAGEALEIVGREITPEVRAYSRNGSQE